MTDPATVLSPATHSDADWARPLLDRQLAVLGTLAEDGLEIVQAIKRQATGADASIHDVAGLATAYARAARAVRMTLLLQSKLITELQTRERLAAHTAFCTRPARMRDRKARVGRIIERIAEADHDDDEVVERLVAEAAERLDQDDIYGDVLSRPVSEIIAAICQDLGLSPDWPRLAEEAWARGEMQSGTVGAPLTAVMARGERRPPHPPPFTGEGDHPQGGGGGRGGADGWPPPPLSQGRITAPLRPTG